MNYRKALEINAHIRPRVMNDNFAEWVKLVNSIVYHDGYNNKCSLILYFKDKIPEYVLNIINQYKYNFVIDDNIIIIKDNLSIIKTIEQAKEHLIKIGIM